MSLGFFGVFFFFVFFFCFEHCCLFVDFVFFISHQRGQV